MGNVPLFRASTPSFALRLAGVLPLLPMLALTAAAAPIRVQVLPTGPVGPGDTAEVRVLALDADGKPVEGVSLDVSVEKGTAGDWRELGQGLYVVPVTFDANGGKPVLTLSGQPSGEPVSVERTLDVQFPVAAERLPVSAEPERAVLGDDMAVTITADGAGPQGMRARANVGELGRPTRSGRTTSVVFTPPKVNFPQVAVITAADVAQPTDSFGFVFVPLVGSVPFPVKGPAGAKVMLEVDGQDFGPVTLGADGKGKVPIDVAPGVQTAIQTTVDGADTTTKSIDLGIPSTQRMGLLPLPQTVGTGGDPVPLRVAVARTDGQPDTGAKVVFEVSRGQVAAAKHLGGGLYEASWTLPDTAGSTTVSARIEGDEVQVDEGKVEVVKGPQGTVTLSVDPWPAEDEGSVEVEVRGEGVAVNDLTVTVLGGEASEPEIRDGALRLTVDAVEADALQVAAGVKLSPSGDGVRHVVVLPARSAVSPGSAVPLLVATVDEDGLPVPNSPVELTVPGGGGSLPAKAETGADGVVLVTLGLEGGDDLVAVRATSHGYVGEAAVVPEPALAGAEAWANIGPYARAWRGLHPMLGTDGAAAAADAPWGESAPPAPEPVAAEPAPVAPAPTVEPEPPASRDHRFARFRASAVVSTYTYEQTPGADPGEVLDRVLTVGGGSGSPASPGGFELDGRVWLDPASVPYVGFHASLRNTWYSIRSEAFQNAAKDQLLQGRVDLLLRAPFETGSDLFWVGARGGFHYDDFIYFEGCIDGPGCAVGYQPLSVPGLAFGPEVGAELGPVFLVGGYTFGLANFGSPYLNAFDLDAGLEIAGPLFAEVGFGSVSRRVDLVGKSSDAVRGSLKDAQMLFDVGLGLAF